MHIKADKWQCVNMVRWVTKFGCVIGQRWTLVHHDNDLIVIVVMQSSE